MSRRHAAAAALAWLASAAALAQDDSAPARQALAVLGANCAPCHGPGSVAEAGIDFITDLRKLVVDGLVTPGNPDASLIVQRVLDPDAQRRMPKGGTPLAAADVAALRAWIAAGALPLPADPPSTTFISDAQVFQRILADAEATAAGDPAAALTVRYLTMTHLRNSGSGEAALDRYRNAVSQVFNSMSWLTPVRQPRFLDAERTIVRVDLRDFGWTKANWDALAAAYPFAAGDSVKLAAPVAALTGDARPVLRADWFLAVATKPPLYYDILGLPTREAELEARLGVDLPTAFLDARPERRTLARAGFQNSGVSNFNRVIDRVPTGYGAFWRSYDFGQSGGRRYVFSHPLGPAPVLGTIAQTGEELGFTPDGGEVIFNLPNGLQAYMLIDSAGKRLDVGPANIVFDRTRGRPIIPGVSCMSCHQNGIITKGDELGGFIAQSGAYSDFAKQIANRVYPPQAELNALYVQDSARFAAAMGAASFTGATSGGDLVELADTYGTEVDLRHAAAELGLPTEAAAHSRLGDLPGPLQLTVAPLLAQRTMPRDAFEQAFAAVAGALAQSSAPRTATVTLGDLRQAVPAGAVYDYPLVLDRDGLVDGLTLALAVQHPLACGLGVALVAPSGRAVVLRPAVMADPCTSDVDAEFTSADSQLGTLIGEAVAGSWLVRFTDVTPAARAPAYLRKVRFELLYH